MIRLLCLGRDGLSLIRHLIRLVPFGHLLVAGTVAAVAVVVNKPTTVDVLSDMVGSLRLAMVPLAMGTAFVLDDPVDPWLATPVPLAARRWVRLVLTAAAVALSWVGVRWVADVAVGLPDGLPTAAMTGELAVLIAIALASAAVAGRRLADRAGGIVAAPVVLLVAGIQFVLPPRWALFVAYHQPPQPGEDPTVEWLAWVAGHQRWALVAAAAVVVLAVGSSDPSRRTPRQLLRAAGASATA